MAEDIGKTIGLIFVLVVLIILTGFGIFQTALPQPLLSGTSALSISNFNLLEQFKELEPGNIVLITVSPSTLGSRFYVSERDDFSDEAEDEDITLTKDFDLAVELNSEQCIYPLKKDSDAILKKTVIARGQEKDIESEGIEYYDDKIWDSDFWGGCASASASLNDIEDEASEMFDVDKDDIVYAGTLEGGFFGRDKCFIVFKSQDKISVAKTLDLEDIRLQATVELNVVGENSKGFIIDTTTGNTEGNLGDVGYVEWAGNLVKQQCKPTNMNSYRAVFYQDEWRLTSDNSYDSYKTSWNEFFENIERETRSLTGLTQSELIIFETAIGSVADDAIIDKEFEIEKDANISSYHAGITGGTDLKNAKFIVEQREVIQAPVIKVYVEGEFIGVKIAEIDGKIISVEAPDFQESSEGQIIVEVENTGDVDGTYTLSVSCDEDFTGDTTDLFGIRKGLTDKHVLTVSKTSVTKKTCADCVVELKSQGGILDKESVTSCVINDDACTVDTYCGIVGDNEVVYNCKNGINTVAETCDSDEKCQNSACTKKPILLQKEELVVTCAGSYINWIWLDCDKCDSKLGTLKTMESYCGTRDYDLSFFTGLILGIVAFGFSFLYFNMLFKVQRTDSRIILGILSLMLGFIAFILSSTLIEHWVISLVVAVIILVLGGLAKTFIPFI